MKTGNVRRVRAVPYCFFIGYLDGDFTFCMVTCRWVLCRFKRRRPTCSTHGIGRAFRATKGPAEPIASYEAIGDQDSSERT